MAEKVNLRIAGIGLSIESGDEKMLRHIGRFCGKFAVAERGDWTLSIERRAKLPAVKKTFWNGGGFSLHSGPVRLEGDSLAKTLRVTATRKPGWGDLLRAAASVLIVRRGGILLHGAAILAGGKARVFFGPSGRGKTTLSRLAEKQGMEILTDESVAILPSAGGRGFTAWATPFYGELGRVSVAGGAPLELAALLEHAPRHSLIPLARKKFFMELARNAFFFPGNRCSVEALFDNVMKLAENIPGYILQFLPNGTLWNFIDDRIGMQTAAK